MLNDLGCRALAAVLVYPVGVEVGSFVYRSVRAKRIETANRAVILRNIKTTVIVILHFVYISYLIRGGW